MRFRTPRSKGKLGLFAGLVLALSAVALTSVNVALGVNTVPLNPAHVGATNPGLQPTRAATCPTPPAGQEGWFGWHFIMPGNQQLHVPERHLRSTAGTKSRGPVPGQLPSWRIPTTATRTSGRRRPTRCSRASATSSGDGTSFNLSHTCPGTDVPEEEEHLTVTKTVDTTFDREHFWSIDKSVDTDNESHPQRAAEDLALHRRQRRRNRHLDHRRDLRRVRGQRSQRLGHGQGREPRAISLPRSRASTTSSAGTADRPWSAIRSFLPSDPRGRRGYDQLHVQRGRRFVEGHERRHSATTAIDHLLL